MRRLAALLLLLAGLATAAPADDGSVRAEVDARKLGVDDQVQLTLSLEGAVRLSEEVALAPLTNLRRAGGPFLSTQVSMTNGSISQQRVYTWVLQPTAAGKAEIGAFSVKLVGGEKATAPIALEIVPGSIRPRAARGGSPFDQDPFGGGDPFDRLFGRGRRANTRQAAPKVFVEASADRTRLHVGEPLLLTYYIYTQTQISDVQFSDAPQFPGFWSEELARHKESSQAENATVEGESFGRIPIAQKLLFPTKAGKLEIPAAASAA